MVGDDIAAALPLLKFSSYFEQFLHLLAGVNYCFMIVAFDVNVFVSITWFD